MTSGDVLLVQEKEMSQTQVQVIGEVLRPGQVPVPEDGSVITVLNTVGGATPGAALTGVTILRDGQTLPVNLVGYSDTGVIPGNIRLKAGDTLVVPRNKKQFAVLGAVLRPGLAAYPEDGRLDVIAALALAGGSSTEADLKNGVIIRKQTDATAVENESNSREPVTVKVDLSDALKKGLPSLSLPLEPGDVLYIPVRRTGGNPSALVQLMSVVPFLGFLIR
jgi:protein involved in polysaccharide export with SLBB domain